MRWRCLAMAMALLSGPGSHVPAASQASPAERASRALNQELATDRLRDAAEDARAADAARAAGPPPPASAGATQIEIDRAAIRPDVGRPEELGRSGGAPRSIDANPNVTR
jgi:hypothetical protein